MPTINTKPCTYCSGTGLLFIPAKGYLRKIRNRTGLSLKKAGALIGVSAMHLSDIELGKRRFTKKIQGLYGRLEAMGAEKEWRDHGRVR